MCVCVCAVSYTHLFKRTSLLSSRDLIYFNLFSLPFENFNLVTFCVSLQNHARSDIYILPSYTWKSAKRRRPARTRTYMYVCMCVVFVNKLSTAVQVNTSIPCRLSWCVLTSDLWPPIIQCLFILNVTNNTVVQLKN